MRRSCRGRRRLLPASEGVVNRPYMGAPGLPSYRLVRTRGRLPPYIRTLVAKHAHCP
jgi:hypothetical protein